MKNQKIKELSKITTIFPHSPAFYDVYFKNGFKRRIEAHKVSYNSATNEIIFNYNGVLTKVDFKYVKVIKCVTEGVDELHSKGEGRENE